MGFIFFTLLAAASNSTRLFIAARMLTGVTVASNVLNPAIIGDLFENDERGSAMSLIMLAPLIGGAIGPAIAGTIAQTVGWRIVLLVGAGLAICCEILFLTCFRETYKMSILRRRAKQLQQESSHYEEGAKGERNTHQNLKKLWHAMTRPFAVLFGSTVLMLLSLFGSVVFSLFYVMSISLPNILQDIYGFTPAQTGSAFMVFSKWITVSTQVELLRESNADIFLGAGSLVGVFVCNSTLDKIYINLRSRSATSTGRPEYRLPITIIGGALIPLSVVAYGWIAQYKLPVGYLLFTVALLDFTLMLAMIPMSAYVVDAFGNYSASALTGVIVTRCLMGTFLPLTTAPLAEALGWGWGCTCLGSLSLALAIIPVLLMRYGQKWRQKSEFTRDA
jgi:hypothetical protein